MQPKQCIAIIDSIKAYAKQNPTEAQVYEDWFQAVVNLRDALPQDKRFDAYKYSGELRSVCAAMMGKMKTGEDVAKVYDIIGRTYLFEAKDVFDSYCIYLEWNRAPEKKFYQPRRKVLRTVANALQDLADDRLDLLAISMPPGCGKTALAIFYLTWLAGRNPDEPMLTGSHSNSFVRGVYDECLRIFDKDGEYLWNDVFPDVTVSDTNALDCRIDLGKRKRFETLEFTSVGKGNAGLYRATTLLYCDDLVSGIEVALSKPRLDKLWETYTTDLRQRKIGNKCKELHIATRWSVHDVIGRLEQNYGDSDRDRFIVMPAMNEKDESNFDYDYSAMIGCACDNCNVGYKFNSGANISLYNCGSEAINNCSFEIDSNSHIGIYGFNLVGDNVFINFLGNKSNVTVSNFAALNRTTNSSAITGSNINCISCNDSSLNTMSISDIYPVSGFQPLIKDVTGTSTVCTLGNSAGASALIIIKSRISPEMLIGVISYNSLNVILNTFTSVTFSMSNDKLIGTTSSTETTANLLINYNGNQLK